eukprot:CAMPEP_0115011188 /NCGR_PEP_ID=MMETSP0216-20121206/23822_1 /TAXON_ID=223996 /ORGANISM="Protocruzia adherens, Strain Boccale" /LENGTH=538 /DNA_ID=CAMNT_0002379665 /DNA_START=107 /DNA_END=1723 /DNA_ORIENTATION=+
MSSRKTPDRALKEKLKTNPDIKAVTAAGKRVSEVTDKIRTQVSKNEIEVGKKQNLNERLTKLKDSESSQDKGFEKNIRDSKVRQSRQQIQELQSRLEELNTNIDILSKPEDKDMKRSPKPDLRSGKERKEFFDQFHKGQEVNREFTKKLNHEQRDRLRREKKRLQEIELLRQQDLEADAKAMKDREEDRARQLKLQAFEKREKAKKEREERAKFREETLKSKVQKPLFKQKESEMRRSIDASMPTLEKRKKDLAEKRAVFQPEELKKFAKDDEERLQKILAERRQKREEERRHPGEWKPSNLASSYTQRVVAEEKEERQRQRLREEMPKSLVEKRRNYSQLVKEMYSPKVDDNKRSEMEQIISSLKTKPRMPKKSDAHSRSVPQSLSSFRNETSEGDEEIVIEDGVKKKKVRSTRHKFKKNPMLPEEKKDRREAIKVDYLREIRDKRERDEKDGITKNYNDMKWETDLENNHLSKEEKLAKIKQKTDLIEGKARRNEDLLKISKGVNEKDLKVSEEVSDMYVESIKAKLALLDQLQQK